MVPFAMTNSLRVFWWRDRFSRRVKVAGQVGHGNKLVVSKSEGTDGEQSVSSAEEARGGPPVDGPSLIVLAPRDTSGGVGGIAEGGIFPVSLIV